jgi:hypothetical protein
MKSEIAKVERYECPLCHNGYVAQGDAEKCFSSCEKKQQKEAKQKKRTADWEVNTNLLRHEAQSLEDIKRLIVEHSKKHFGVVLSITKFDLLFTDVSCSHSCPIGKQKNMGGVYLFQVQHVTGAKIHIPMKARKRRRK